ncbi:MAG: undecaprenyldiphospho-muramoylpentapeptide beta-N-acetylglucosaminyltransferase [Oligoflexia bacterium]|nr:undecaprenyldiphospho-muramoylpentapeptide beta-N-acetylglucosaminyltransferase [Oligoflexia bacterium]
MKKEGSQFVYFVTGGSGGHFFPLLEVSKELESKYQIQSKYVGSKAAADKKLIEKTQKPVLWIPAGKIKGQGIFTLIKTALNVFAAIYISFIEVLRNPPQYVLSAGGYSGAPFLLAASLLGVKCAVFEQNKVPGLANKVMSFFCKTIFLHFASTAEAFPKKNTVVVGHPFRKEMVQKAKEIQLQKRNGESFHILVFGGSQGARGINQLVFDSLPTLLENGISIYHQIGSSDFQSYKEKAKEYLSDKYQICEFIDDMGVAYGRSDLVVCRAGASTLVELAAIGKAAILIPLVSKDNHQVPNARELEKEDAAICCIQTQTSASMFSDLVLSLKKDKQKLKTLEKNVQKFMVEGSAEKIASSIAMEI